ncbi:wall-associated receptor kinase 5-like [Ipomoea triloba]|uniref:wall-associated receptor kinase 5-like n=1 Tax=Ipomoea triloba TaxID=35885 RepID=UPI00125E8610|nr:wall-associated receptor kinase 5-like [Ipomoea triloba]
MEFCAPIACGRCLLMALVFLSASAIAQTTTTNLSQAAAPIGRRGCPTRCGNLAIPYPFGIGSGCAFDSEFQILCDTSSNPPNTVLTTGAGNPALVYDISDRHIWVGGGGGITVCYDSKGAWRPLQFPFNSTSQTMSFQRLNHYSYSLENKFAIVGCDDTLLISHGTNDVSSCTSRCSNASQVPPVNGTTCSGVGCCQLPMPKDLNKLYNISMVSAMNHTKVWSFNPCAYSFFGDTSRFRFLGASDLNNPNFPRRVHETVPLVMDWAIGDLNCKEAQHITEYGCKGNSHCVDSDTGGYRCSCDHGYQGNPYLGCIDPPIGKLSCDEAKKGSEYACHANSHCLDSDTGLGGYRCRCDNGYEGNPYLSPGCTDIDECKNPETMKSCEQRCINFPGGFNCSCLEGYFGDGRKGGQGCILINKKPAASSWVKLSLGIGLGTLVFVALATSLSYIIKKTNDAKMRLKFFEQNGGFLLEQKITDGGSDGTDVTKIFSAKELRQATNNFAQDMILGQGGNGIVFKGILLPNQLQVAVKRSKTVDDTQIEQFINEVVILSRINHRHVVKLLGCCLEAEVPLLVYEYISNGTLYYHIHGEAGGSDWLSWENRLRIAIEAAGALAYLYSSASTPIIHRDVKSANILIDENYTAKISDFGASRLVPLDHTHVATLVQGTLGYLDPEYFQTSLLTEKSDVYSFGVVLAELLTERKPVSPYMSEEDRNLSSFFVRSLNENRLFQIIVPRLVREGTLDQLQRIAELVKRCLQLKGEDRPQMKEVASELERIRNSTKVSWTTESSCLLSAEDESLDLYAAPINQ